MFEVIKYPKDIIDNERNRFISQYLKSVNLGDLPDDLIYDLLAYELPDKVNVTKKTHSLSLGSDYKVELNILEIGRIKLAKFITRTMLYPTKDWGFKLFKLNGEWRVSIFYIPHYYRTGEPITANLKKIMTLPIFLIQRDVLNTFKIAGSLSEVTDSHTLRKLLCDSTGMVCLDVYK